MKLPKFPAADILIILIGAAGAVFFTYLFFQDMNATLTRLEEMPVGIITSRYNIAQRRFNNRLVWDRLQNNSPIYNGDVIRTDNLSEVTISFDYGESISLFSNTLIQVFADSGGSRIDFSSGEIIINTSSQGYVRPINDNTLSARRRRRSSGDLEITSSVSTGSEAAGSERTGSERNTSARTRRSEDSENSGLVINTGDQRVRVGRNSAIRLASLDDGDLELSISEGTVVLEEAPPEPQNIASANQRRRRDQENPENSILAERTGRTENPESVGSERTGSQRTGSEGTERARRSENSSDTEASRSIVINTGEQRIRTERNSSIRVDSQEGQLAISVNEGAMVLESASTNETLSLETGQRVRINSRRRSDSDETIELSELVIETFEPEQPAARTRQARAAPSQETAQDNTASTRTERNRTETNAADTNRAERNTDINRTETNRTGRNSTETADSERTGSRQRELLPAPRNRIPADQHTITAQMIIDSRSLTFSWETVRDANGYILTISRENEGFRSTVLQTPVLTETTYTLENIRQYRGTLFWSTEAVRVSDDGNIEQRGQIRENTLIIDIPRIERATQENSSERRIRSQ